VFGLKKLRRFINSLKRAIGVDDPDLQHGSIGREAADKKNARAVKRIKTSREKNSDRDSSQKRAIRRACSTTYQIVTSYLQL
jgi:hypothetical protein